jgi:hypothetical protein
MKPRPLSLVHGAEVEELLAVVSLRTQTVHASISFKRVGDDVEPIIPPGLAHKAAQGQ